MPSRALIASGVIVAGAIVSAVPAAGAFHRAMGFCTSIGLQVLFIERLAARFDRLSW